MLKILLALLFGLAVLGEGENPFIEKYLSQAARLQAEGKYLAARAAVERALERDHRHLGALSALAELAEDAGDKDTAIYTWHQWLQVVDAAEKRTVSSKDRKAVEERLNGLDPSASEFRSMSRGYIRELLRLAKDHQKKSRLHSSLELYFEVLHIEPLNLDARAGVRNIRRTGGEDVAVEDAFAGAGDPTAGLDPEWLAEENAKHDTWDTAWTKDTDNYRFKTDAGFMVLQTSSIAMEQMNRAYRKFFHYKEDGGATPKIGVLVYKTRAEYLEENNLPENDWTGGFFNGSTVQTYMGGPSGKDTIRQMYGTLFHEAAHQFVSLTGRGGVPGWLNEAYASFFEGTTILSNGSVRWNQVATHRLFPLARRMEQGWMNGPSDGVRDPAGEWATPDNAPTLRILVENQYRWGPPWYAPTWGVVYFLYNYRDEDGALVYRDSLNQYYYSNAASMPVDRRIEHFENVVLKSAELSPVQDIDALSELWHDWILELRDIQLGKRKARKSNLEHGEAALARGETEAAVDFLEEAFLHQPEDPEVLWKLAGALEAQKELDRAAALYLQFSRELELTGKTDDERYPVAQEKLRKLDPLFRRHEKLKAGLLTSGLALARGYRERGLPLMALEIARRMSAQFSMPEALDFYIDVAAESGRSLARWKIAYNEFDLVGWSGAEGYRAYGRMIDADIRDTGGATPEGEFFTADLAYDEAFDGDYSLEVEMKFGEQASLLGIAFGRKDANTTHAVVLHPAGFLDISTRDGGVWTYLDHRAIQFSDDWQKLRIDLVGSTLDVYLNDQYLRSLKMASRDSVQGGIGLITGTGRGFYRNVRYMARDPYDPASRIERELAMRKVADAEIERPAGTFSGVVPPPIAETAQWIQGDPVRLVQLHGRPALLVFWSGPQETAIPTAAYYRHLAEQYQKYDLGFVLVVSGEHSPKEAQALLEKSPMDGWSVALDTQFETFNPYNVAVGGWGMPRMLLLDVDGVVVWEGDPGLQPGRGWKTGDSDTYLDGPLKTLVDRLDLNALYQNLGAQAEAEALLAEGKPREALVAIAKLADLDADYAPEVHAARDLRDRIEALGTQWISAAAEEVDRGHPLYAAALYQKVAEEFRGSATGDFAAARHKDAVRSAAFKTARKAWREIEKAVAAAQRGRANSEWVPFFDAALGLSDVDEIHGTVATLRDWLYQDSLEEMLRRWPELTPEGRVAEQFAALTQ